MMQNWRQIEQKRPRAKVQSKLDPYVNLVLSFRLDSISICFAFFIFSLVLLRMALHDGKLIEMGC